MPLKFLKIIIVMKIESNIKKLCGLKNFSDPKFVSTYDLFEPKIFFGHRIFSNTIIFLPLF